MAFKMGGGGLTNEPNVVPMIDILLVLLIIFMIMQPLARKSVDLQLPDPTPQDKPPDAKPDQIILEILPNGTFAVNKEPMTRENLARRLKEIYDPRPEKIMFVKGDPEAAAVRDAAEQRIMQRVELSALASLLIKKGVFTIDEFNEELIVEAAALEKALERRFPGFKAQDNGMDVNLALARDTMHGWLP